MFRRYRTKRWGGGGGAESAPPPGYIGLRFATVYDVLIIGEVTRGQILIEMISVCGIATYFKEKLWFVNNVNPIIMEVKFDGLHVYIM